MIKLDRFISSGIAVWKPSIKLIPALYFRASIIVTRAGIIVRVGPNIGNWATIWTFTTIVSIWTEILRFRANFSFSVITSVSIIIKWINYSLKYFVLQAIDIAFVASTNSFSHGGVQSHWFVHCKNFTFRPRLPLFPDTINYHIICFNGRTITTLGFMVTNYTLHWFML